MRVVITVARILGLLLLAVATSPFWLVWLALQHSQRDECEPVAQAPRAPKHIHRCTPRR